MGMEYVGEILQDGRLSIPPEIIYPCQDKAYNLKKGLIGSIKNQRFKEFWFSEKDNFFKIVPSRDCNNHCVANTKNNLILEYLEADKGHLGFV